MSLVFTEPAADWPCGTGPRSGSGPPPLGPTPLQPAQQNSTASVQCMPPLLSALLGSSIMCVTEIFLSLFSFSVQLKEFWLVVTTFYYLHLKRRDREKRNRFQERTVLQNLETIFFSERRIFAENYWEPLPPLSSLHCLGRQKPNRELVSNDVGQHRDFGIQ